MNTPRRRVMSFIAVALCAAFIPAGRGGAAAGGQDAPAMFDFREVVRSAKERVFPAVVYIKCLRQSHENGKLQSVEVGGSGVLISPEGDLLTNWHVVDKATEVRCLLHDGRTFYAEVVGSDKDLDVALVRLRLAEKEPGLPCAELGESEDLAEGDFVMAMGAPWGLRRSVSIGIVSCTRRYLDKHSEYSLWLQTDAAISPGNSGGPLVNTAGRIVGLNTLGTSFGGDMGFAVPSSTIKAILPRLKQHGDIRWGWTGMDLQAIRDFNRNVYFNFTNGVMVAGTDSRSPARQAGILEQDRIVRINGEPVNGLTDEDLPAIRRRLALMPIGKPLTLELARESRIFTVDLVPLEKGKVEGDEFDCRRWNLTVKAINRFDNKDLYFYSKEGIFVFGVKHPGNAMNAGLVPQDIIMEIEGEPVARMEDIRRLYQKSLDNLDTRPRVTLKILRNGMMRQVILDFARDYEKD